MTEPPARRSLRRATDSPYSSVSGGSSGTCAITHCRHSQSRRDRSARGGLEMSVPSRIEQRQALDPQCRRTSPRSTTMMVSMAFDPHLPPLDDYHAARHRSTLTITEPAAEPFFSWSENTTPAASLRGIDGTLDPIQDRAWIRNLSYREPFVRSGCHIFQFVRPVARPLAGLGAPMLRFRLIRLIPARPVSLAARRTRRCAGGGSSKPTPRRPTCRWPRAARRPVVPFGLIAGDGTATTVGSVGPGGLIEGLDANLRGWRGTRRQPRLASALM